MSTHLIFCVCVCVRERELIYSLDDVYEGLMLGIYIGISFN
jgi:hypothetical protein